MGLAERISTAEETKLKDNYEYKNEAGREEYSDIAHGPLFYGSLILMSLTALLPVFIMGFHARPLADDFDYSLLTHQALARGEGLFGLLRAALATDWYFYQHHQGLYTAAFFHSLQPGIFGEKLYGIGTCVLVLFVLLCLYGALRLISPCFGGSRCYCFTYASLITAMLMLAQPSFGEGLFWCNGMFNYTPFTLLTILNAAILLRLELQTPSGTDRNRLLAASCLIAFLISGGNHVSTFSDLMILLTFLLYELWKKRKLMALLPFLCGAAGFCLMWFAPGTRIMETTVTGASVPETILQTFLHTSTAILNWTNAVLFSFLLLMTPLSLRVIRRCGLRLSWMHCIAVFLYGAMILCGMYAAPYFAMGYFGYGRLTNVVYIMFLLFAWLFYTAVLAAAGAGNRHCDRSSTEVGSEDPVRRKRRTAVLLIAAGACLSAAFIAPQNHERGACGAAILRELYTGQAKMYRDVQDMRLFYYKDPTLTEVIVEPMGDRQSMLYLVDITEDPNHWLNQSISAYYGKSIRLSQPGEEATHY